MTLQEWIKLLSSHQISAADSSHFGLFPMIRTHVSGLYRRKDTCVFGSASIAYILQDILPLLSGQQKQDVEKIVQNIRSIYPRYQNKTGRNTYNFWMTKPSSAFPNGVLLHRFKHFQLPDDIDDTALILLTSQPHKTDSYELAQSFTRRNRQLRTPHLHNSFFEQMDNEQDIYQTWFGEKMPLEFDICVLCNWMTYALHHAKPLQHSDSTTLEFIKTEITTGRWLTHPFQLSRHYGTSYWIAYYFARLYKAHPTYFPNDLAANIQKYSYSQIQTSSFQEMKDVIWLLAYLKLGGKWAEDIQLAPSICKEQFPVFLGALLAPYSPTIPFPFVKSRWTRFEWMSESMNLAFLLEAHVLLSTNVPVQQK